MGHECSECTFVPDADTLLTFCVSRELRNSVSHEPVFVGKFTMNGWVGHSGFYLFHCPDCEDVCVDYPHGYRENGYLYIRCGRCRYEVTFTPGRKYKEIYKREKVVAPPTFWETIRELWRLRKRNNELRKSAAIIEDKYGVRVIVNGKDTSKRM